MSQKFKIAKLTTSGFTLVEVAVVLVILGLLIGGVLRGSELINSAKVRSLIDQKTGIQSALVAFTNRYKAMPGDLTAAQASFIGNNIIPSIAPWAGNAVTDYGSWAGGTLYGESVMTFQNLTATGLLICGTCMGVTPITNNELPYFYIQAGSKSLQPTITNLSANSLMYATGAPTTSFPAQPWLDLAPANTVAKNFLFTGYGLPSPLLMQMDIKSDDGNPATGNFRLGDPVGTAVSTGNGWRWLDHFPSCVNTFAGPVYTWRNTAGGNCGGAWLF